MHYADVWEFLTFKDFVTCRERLLPHLGRECQFWEFMYQQWLAHGIVQPDDHSEPSAK
ncbi:MAG: hypothetical protein ONB48_18180 [candidate division KSB1 bacterium]|nr:hypothetical protein [candidate division KSB1 bacterium]MDZ7275823.1 hypothetical protein [candidate division KSB1 bacterium]MDZ7287573.1 hypothetical protein [candidate division KSB1 bacterium]MDZ7350551.1 hypothetical protein [candidate division KSB1 bacterium]MDZ7354923.1 hypothetical protein [candidate division KSB1 bacterium]